MADTPRYIRKLKRRILCRLALRFPRWTGLLESCPPLAVQEHGCSGAGARQLMVFLPGIGDMMEDYARYGFFESVRRKNLPIDIVAVDAHYGYYARRTVLERLREEIIRPRQERGYRDISLVGISLGGLGALLYASEYPDDVSHVVALAPFLGEPSVTREIAGAGGIKHWRPGDIPPQDHPRRLWQWLKRYAGEHPDLPALYLGYGEQDKFAPGHRLLAEILPPERVFMTAGGHDWRTWKRIWDRVLVEYPVQR